MASERELRTWFVCVCATIFVFSILLLILDLELVSLLRFDTALQPVSILLLITGYGVVCVFRRYKSEILVYVMLALSIGTLLSGRVSIREIQHVVHPTFVDNSPLSVRLLSIILSMLTFTAAMLAYQIRENVLMTGFTTLKRINMNELQEATEFSHKLIDEYYTTSHYYSPGICLHCRDGEAPTGIADTLSANNNCQTCGNLMTGKDVMQICQGDYVTLKMEQQAFNL